MCHVPQSTPHSPHIAMEGSVCPVPLSFAITHGIACCFLFLRLLRCFSSAGSRSHGGAVPLLSGDWEVPFGDPGFQGCMLLAQAYRSLPRPSSAPKPSHPPDGMIAVGFLYDGSKYSGFPCKDPLLVNAGPWIWGVLIHLRHLCKWNHPCECHPTSLVILFG